MAKRTPLDVVPSGFFVFRTPLLPADELERWSAGLEAPSAAGDEQLEQALAADRRRLRRRLQALIERPEIGEALFVASPSLVEGLAAWRQDPESKKGRRAEEALVRYFYRMATRPTPFGLFSGCSLGELDGESRVELAPRRAYRRHTRLDMDYLFTLAHDLGRQPEVRRLLRFRPSSSLYRAAGRLRYAEARLSGRVRSHHLVAVETADYLEATLDRARGGATIAELAQALVDDDPDGEIRFDEAEEFVGELIDSQLLVSDLEPLVTGPEPIHELIDQLQAQPETRPAAAVMAAVRDDLEALDAGGLGAAPARYEAVAQRLEQLPAKVELPLLFQVDMVKPAIRASLGDEVIEELGRGLALLHRLLGRLREDSLARFRQDFQARYEDGRAVPLVEVLDEEVGIGFGRSGQIGAEAAPLLEGLAFPPRPTEELPRMPWAGREHLLMTRLEELLARGETTLELREKDLAALDDEPRPPLPDAFQVMAAVAAESAEALAAGDFKLLLRGAYGPSGARLLGRFCHADGELHRRVEEHLRAEEKLAPEAIFAEIVHLPEGRIGNILSRPVLRDYEIPFLGRSGAPAERQIPITDLLVSVAGDAVVLYSKSLGRQVIPRLTSAHNFSNRSLGLYRFLCTLQSQKVREGLSWYWGPFESLSFLPRVTSGRLVLARARWRVEGEEIKKLAKAAGAARFRAVQAWRERRRLPRRVMLVDGDNELLVDLDNVLSIDAFLALVRRRGQLTLCEPFPAGGDLWFEGPEGRFHHELLIPFVARRPPSPRPRRPPPSTGRVRRAFPPGSEWLYAKLYTGSSTADRLLREVVAPVVRRALASGAAERWFFIRYGDPHWHLRLRLHGAPERLQREVLPALEAALRPRLDDGQLWRVQLDTYEREIERYGGDEGIEVAERFFHADSEAVLAIVEQLEGDEGATARWQLTLRGIDLLLDDLGLSGEGKLDVLERMQRAYALEFGVEGGFRKQLGGRLRQLRDAIESVLDPAPSADHPLAPGFAALAGRSRALLPVVAELRRREAAGRLIQPLADLAPSFVHMFTNRLLRSDGRAHELVLYDFLYRVYRSRLARQQAEHKKKAVKKKG